MKSKPLPYFLGVVLLLLLPAKALQGQSDADKLYIKSRYDSVKANYQKDYGQAISWLDSIQEYTLSRCLIAEYSKALRWSMQCALDYHKLGELYHYLSLGEETLLAYEHDLGPLWAEEQTAIKAIWAAYYFKIASYEKAIQAHQEIIYTLTQKDTLSQRDKELVARSYQYLGTIQKLRGDYQDAITHFWSSLEYIKEVWEQYENMGRIAYTYQQIGKCFEGMDNDRQARLYNEMALKSLEKAYSRKGAEPNSKTQLKKNLILTNNAIATYYLAKGDSENALQHLERSRAYLGTDDTYLKATAHLLGEVHTLACNYDTALYYFQLSLKEKIEDYGPKNYSNALTYLAIGQLYAQQEQYHKAISQFDTAIEHLTARPEVLEKLEKVDWSTIYAERALINVLGAKAKALSDAFGTTQDTAYLQQAWASAQAAIRLVEVLRINYHSEDDRQFLLKACYPIFEIAMLSGYRLGPAYYEALFETAEKSKALLLVDWHRDLNALQRANIPDSLLEREKQYKAEINIIEGLINEENNKAVADTGRARELFQNLAAAKQKYAELLSFFQEEYGFDGSRQEKEQALLPFIQHELLKSGQSLAEYFLGDEHLFILVVSQDKIEAHHLPLYFPLADWIEQFRSGIYDYHLSPAPTESLFQHTQGLYSTYGWKLYQSLLLPVKSHLKKELIIIPDGILGYIPFEALLTEPVAGQSMDFRRYPYVLKQYQISYCYSARLLKAMKEKRYRSSGLLAFAPSFPKIRNASPLPIAMLRSEIDTLYYNVEEVESIRAILKEGDIKAGPTASKASFLELAPQYKIIHIASHGILNDSVSGHSYIAFYGGEDKSPDHNLLVRDLYGMRLEAELVTLSACETGLGQLRRGEGIISLARGFSYAGAKSIITTFWAVNDLSTTQVMGYFYRHLSKGKTKDKAIHQAKAEYINTQSDPFEAHPFYWASYIVIGDMEPLYGPSRVAWLAAFSLLALFAFYLFWRRRQGKSLFG